MKYRSKPVTIEAVQFDPLGVHRFELPQGVTATDVVGGADNYAYCGFVFNVVTIHGQHTEVKAGDWIITEPDGIHHYPCKPDIFAARYEEARDGN